jgi:hypothetical protein
LAIMQQRPLLNEPCIVTHSGRVVSLEHPLPSDIDALDIAYALAGLVRFTGHAGDGGTGYRWSVGQHCIVGSIMAQVLYPYMKNLDADVLLHDASEAYVGDMSSPMKRLNPQFVFIEHGFHRAVCGAFGVTTTSPAVKAIDMRMLATEKKLFMPEGDWGLSHSPFEPEEWEKVGGSMEVWDYLWTPWPPQVTEDLYLKRMDYLKL